FEFSAVTKDIGKAEASRDQKMQISIGWVSHFGLCGKRAAQDKILAQAQIDLRFTIGQHRRIEHAGAGKGDVGTSTQRKIDPWTKARPKPYAKAQNTGLQPAERLAFGDHAMIEAGQSG